VCALLECVVGGPEVIRNAEAARRSSISASGGTSMRGRRFFGHSAPGQLANHANRRAETGVCSPTDSTIPAISPPGAMGRSGRAWYPIFNDQQIRIVHPAGCTESGLRRTRARIVDVREDKRVPVRPARILNNAFMPASLCRHNQQAVRPPPTRISVGRDVRAVL